MVGLRFEVESCYRFSDEGKRGFVTSVKMGHTFLRAQMSGID